MVGDLCEDEAQPSTLASYKDSIEKHLIPYFGDYSLPKIGHMLIQRYIVKRMGKAKGKTIRNEVREKERRFGMSWFPWRKSSNKLSNP
jgi:hypothetical protein